MSLFFIKMKIKFQNKVRRVALKVTTNIDILIKDFFQNPPSYKGSIILSWKSNEMVVHPQSKIEKTIIFVRLKIIFFLSNFRNNYQSKQKHPRVRQTNLQRQQTPHQTK